MKKFISMFMIFALLLSAFTSFSTISAKAAENTSDPIIDKQVYYISDSETNYNVYGNVILSMVSNENINNYCNSSQTDFWQAVFNWGPNNALGSIPYYENIESAIIIFEAHQGLPLGPSVNLHNDYLLQLSAIFSALKENGCYIIFKCNTDESRFSVNADFLAYVDLHINTDLITPFSKSVLTDLEENFADGEMRDVTFLLNDRCFHPATHSNPNKWTFYNFLSAYLKKYYEEDLNMVGATYNLVLQNKNINILKHIDGSLFYDVFTGDLCDISVSFSSSNYGDVDKVIAVASFMPWENTSIDSTRAHYFIDAINDLQDQNPMSESNNIPLYMLKPPNLNVTSRYPDYTKTIIDATLYNEEWFADILSTFTTNAEFPELESDREQARIDLHDDMLPYDNWPSIWSMCYKPIFLTSYPWITAPTGEDYEIYWGIIETGENDLSGYATNDGII